MQAQTLLDKSDITMLRAFEHGVGIPQEGAQTRRVDRSTQSGLELLTGQGSKRA